MRSFEGPVSNKTKADAKAKRARRFAIRLAPDLGFLCGVLSQIAQRVAAETGAPVPPMVGFLPQLVRRGFQTPYHFALSRDLPSASRPDIQNAYQAIAGYIEPNASDDWTNIRDKLEKAQTQLMFTDLSTDEIEEILVKNIKIT